MLKVTTAQNIGTEALIRSEFMILVTFQGVEIFMNVQLYYSADIQSERIKKQYIAPNSLSTARIHRECDPPPHKHSFRGM
jgi:hypothetical protein